MLDPVEVHTLITEQQVQEKVGELAQSISADYVGSELVVIGILKGAWVFLADLVRRIAVPVTVDFVAASSYGGSTVSSGKVEMALDVKVPVEGRNVLLVEDILDTGLTLSHVVERLKLRRPASLKLCVLLDKPSRRKTEVNADYVGFVIPDRFVVGYGADVGERFRNLPYVGYVEEADPEVQGNKSRTERGMCDGQ